jgi:hypothetical protein
MRALAALGEECDRLSSRMADLVDAEIHRLLFLGAGGRRATRRICLCPEGIPRGIATGVAMIGILCVVASLAGRFVYLDNRWVLIE